MPITLDISEEDITNLSLLPGSRVTLRDPRNDSPLAILTIDDIYEPDKQFEALNVFGSNDKAHPGIKYLFENAKQFYLGGNVEAIQEPIHYDYTAHRCEFVILFRGSLRGWPSALDVGLRKS